MAKMRKPKKTTIRKANSTVTNIQRDSSSAEEERKRKIEEIKEAQKFVDDWNNNYVGKKGMDEKDITKHFENIQLENGLIIQMFMENPIKKMTVTEEGEVTALNYSLRQIDARERNTDKPKWVVTPFPVIDKSVIVAISPQTQLWYYEQKEKLAKYNPTAAESYKIPEVGDIVYTNQFMFKEGRYYIDKQAKCNDFVKNQMELRLGEFDFLFKITNFEIESIVKKEDYNKLVDNYGSTPVVIKAIKEDPTVGLKGGINL